MKREQKPTKHTHLFTLTASEKSRAKPPPIHPIPSPHIPHTQWPSRTPIQPSIHDEHKATPPSYCSSNPVILRPPDPPHLRTHAARANIPSASNPEQAEESYSLLFSFILRLLIHTLLKPFSSPLPTPPATHSVCFTPVISNPPV